MSAGINSEQKREMRFNTHARFGGRCAYCDKPTPFPKGTVDHYMPRALGGTNERQNLRWSCLPCNAAKADMHPDAWERVRPKVAPRPMTRSEIRIAMHRQIVERRRAVEGVRA